MHRASVAEVGGLSLFAGVPAEHVRQIVARLPVEEHTAKVQTILGLRADQVVFPGHGKSDVAHTAELSRILNASKLNSHDWAWLAHAARTAGELYRRMWDEATA